MMRRKSWSALGAPASVFLLAFVVRVAAVLSSRGGLTGQSSYDGSVYYSAADALSFGRMPYRDFVLLHPPGMTLALTPFALLGRATSDLTGYVAANLALMVLGGLNAALVVVVARRLGAAGMGAWLGGAFYALWFGVVYPELGIRLEPLGNTAFLCGLLLLSGGQRGRRRGATVLAGVALGVAVSVKLSWVVPLVVVLVWVVLAGGGLRRAGALLAGTGLAGLLVDGPFYRLGPRQMWQMTVVDQLNRSSIVSRSARVVSMLGSFVTPRSAHGATAPLLGAGVLAVLVALSGLAWQLPAARLLVCVAFALGGFLLLNASYFPFYLGVLGVPLSLILATAVPRCGAARWLRWSALALVTAVVVVSATTSTAELVLSPVRFNQPFPRSQMAEVLLKVRCVMTVTPTALIQLDVLSTDLAHHCANWVDTTGRTFGADAVVGARRVPRRENAKWQADVRRYLFSGQVAVLVGDAGSLDARTLRAVESCPRLFASRSISMFLVRHAPGVRSVGALAGRSRRPDGRRSGRRPGVIDERRGHCAAGTA